MGRAADDIVGHSFLGLLPDQDAWVSFLERAYQSEKWEEFNQATGAKGTPIPWSYEIWPIWTGQHQGLPTGFVLQVKETPSVHRRIALVNEALLISAVRQHELMEQTLRLNDKLRSEIEERRRAEAAIEQLAFYDPLTDLPNRRLLMDRLHHATLACSRKMLHGAVVFIDLDHFKQVNDSRGHHVGDLLLQQVAQRLRRCVREDDTIARLGGDEFVVMLKELDENLAKAVTQAHKVATKILLALDKPFLLEGHPHHCGGSIGVSLFSKNRESVEHLFKCADLALYRAKSAGGRTIRFFQQDMETKAADRAALEADLRRAVRQNQFRLLYQPQVDAEGCVRGVEALLRWQHPERGLLLPAEFICYAEQHEIIDSIGLWALEASCKQMVLWSHHPLASKLTLALNVTAREFGHAQFVSRTLTTIDDIGADPSKIILEFTERVMFSPIEEVSAKMMALKRRGVAFALDDFGIGFSSLACLKSLPLTQLKIDRSFVREVTTNHSDAIIIAAVIELGTSLGLTVVAEGVETCEQRTFLLAHGCRLFQGFLFHRPESAEQLIATIERPPWNGPA